MRKAAAALLGAAIFWGIVLAGMPEPIVQARAAAYNLWAVEGGRIGVICTGTLVRTADGPRFLSAGHCVADAPNARYYISQGSDPDLLVRARLKWWEFEGVGAWKEGDWAVFELPGPFDASAALPLCAERPAVGEDVWAWTGPLGMLPILRGGSYSGELHFPDSPEDEEAIGGMMFADINGAGGSSGSGMLRLEAGRPCVFGVWVGGFRDKPAGAILSHLPPVLRQ